MPSVFYPDPSTLVLPWDVTAGDWATALREILIVEAKLPGDGMFQRHAAALRKARRSPYSTKKPPPIPSLHKPMFRRPWFHPTFAMPGRDLLRELASTPLLEIGAGSGALSLFVAAAGGNVVATDPRPWPMGYGYGHRDTEADLSFAQRQRRSRRFATTHHARLRRPYRGVFEGPMQAYAMSRAGAVGMAFPKTGREPRPLRSLATYFPVERLDAKEAIRRYPDRDVLVSYPDPQDDWWVRDVLEGLAPGRRLYLSEDHGLDSTPEGYELVSRLTEHSFRLRGEEDDDNEGNTCAVLIKEERH